MFTFIQSLTWTWYVHDMCSFDSIVWEECYFLQEIDRALIETKKLLYSVDGFTENMIEYVDGLIYNNFDSSGI